MAGTVMVPESMPAPPYVKGGVTIPPSIAEIPRAVAGQTVDPGRFVSGRSASEVVEYEPQNEMAQPQLRSLREFISEGDDRSQLGMELREDRRKLKTGPQVEGLLIVDIVNGSPAAAAGLHANKRTLHDVVEGGIAMGALVFPPAIVAVAGLEQIPFGESYDMIIGVDGVRVTNFLDFEDLMRDVQPGEIVYLSIVRDGNRVQVPVRLPRTMPPPVF
jgi:S1-C subfamily serine protease